MALSQTEPVASGTRAVTNGDAQKRYGLVARSLAALGLECLS